MNIDNKRKKTYTYKVYGLNIESDISLPQLMPINDNEFKIDVTILFGKVPNQEGETIEVGDEFNNISSLSAVSFLLDGVARYHISNGDTIIIEPCDNCDIEIVKNYLLGYTFGILLFQRNNIVIHGGTVVILGQGVIFTGDSGAGKSTLTTALRNKGYSFMNDDISVTDFDDNNRPVVHSGYAQQKLCKDVLLKLGYDLKDYKLIDQKRNKYIVPADEHFVSETLPLGAIFELTQGDNSEVIINKILGIEKLKVLQKNLYNIGIAKQCKMNPEFYKKSLELLQKVDMYRIIRPKNKFTQEEQIDKIEYILKARN